MVEFRQQFESFGLDSAKRNPALVGKWHQANGNPIEFRANGSLALGSAKGPRELNYRFTDEKTIEIDTLDGLPLSQRRILSLQGDELIMADLRGTQTTFQRTK
jgi:hypothetical protein